MNGKLVLDVGCGHNFEGEVNVDLFVEATAHRSEKGDMRSNTDVSLCRIPNFIQANCVNLPFKDNAFDEVVSNHLIEHIEDPFGLLKEMVRVAKPNGTIRVTTPHKMSHNRKWILHQHSFNGKWFEKAFRVLGVALVESHRTYRMIPHDYFPLFRLPYFIQVTGRVKKYEKTDPKMETQ